MSKVSKENISCRLSPQAREWIADLAWEKRMSLSSAGAAAVEYAKRHEKEYLKFCEKNSYFNYKK